MFHSACWEWDDLGIVLATLILTRLVPGGVVWVAVDDTLCHKRGTKFAFGRIFLDAVMSSKGHKTLRFGLNWGVLGIAASSSSGCTIRGCGACSGHPMAWFVGSLTILWYCAKSREGTHVERERPWYEDRVLPTFTDMLGALRLQMWEFKVYGESGEELPSPECIRKLLHKLSAVA